MPNFTHHLVLPILLLLPFITADVRAVGGRAPILLDDFHNGLRPGWEHKSFKGETSYTSGSEDGVPCLKAISRGTASGMFYKLEFDPAEYPVLSWSWKVDNIISNGDARFKASDDYAARIYVVFPSLFFWNTRAINYIWANRLPKGSSIKSSYTRNAVMIAVESGSENLGEWQEYKMNIHEDFVKNFGYTPPPAGAIAIMTDTDNTGESATSCFGAIKLLPPE